MADAGEGRNQSPYAWCKATNVELINRYGEWYGLDYVIVYFYNAYGDRKVLNKDYYTLIDIWEDCINNKEKLPIVSPGTQIRNFTYVKDIVQGVIAAG
jgi:UDP-glucose 4-epimerase